MTSAIPTTTDSSPSGIPPLMTVNEVAKVLRVSTRSIWRLVTHHKLVMPIRIGGSIRWRRSDIEAWIAMGCPTVSDSFSLEKSGQIQMIDSQDHGTIQGSESHHAAEPPN